MSDVVILDPTVDPRWEALAAGPQGSLFTSPPWLRSLRDAYGFEFRAAIALDGDIPRSGLAWAHVHDLRGERLVALPFCDYADPILGEADDWNLLSSALTQCEVTVSMRVKCNAAAVHADERFSLINETLWHGIDLLRNPKAMWADVREEARRAVRKSQKTGVVVRCAHSLDDVRAFHDMHCEVRREKYRLLAQPVRLFESIWEQFAATGDAHLFLAERDGVPVAGTFYVVWGDTLYYKFNASRRDALEGRPNDLLTWSGMVRGHELGLARVDLGQSDPHQEGLVRYKEKFATEKSGISWFTYRTDAPPDATACIGAQTLGALTELLTGPNVPSDIYKHAGALLYRNFC